MMDCRVLRRLRTSGGRTRPPRRMRRGEGMLGVRQLVYTKLVKGLRCWDRISRSRVSRRYNVPWRGARVAPGPGGLAGEPVFYKF